MSKLDEKYEGLIDIINLIEILDSEYGFSDYPEPRNLEEVIGFVTIWYIRLQNRKALDVSVPDSRPLPEPGENSQPIT